MWSNWCKSSIIIQKECHFVCLSNVAGKIGFSFYTTILQDQYYFSVCLIIGISYQVCCITKQFKLNPGNINMPRLPHIETREKIRPPKAVSMEHMHGSTVPTYERTCCSRHNLKRSTNQIVHLKHVETCSVCKYF
jgi:hypothetical protein